MSGTVADKKRLFRVTSGNLRQNHLYIHGHYDFFPADCIGASRKSGNGNGVAIRILLEGLGETIETDIGSDAGTAKPRRFFRGRTWVRRFYEYHNIKTGDVLALERVAQCAIQEIDHFPEADVVVGGLPCQGFSNLGERVPNDPRNQLWRQFMRAVEDAAPKAFVA